MLSRILIVGVASLFFVTACESSNQSYGEKYDIDDTEIEEVSENEDPTAEDTTTVENYEITGMATITLSDNLEFECEYGKKGSEVKCNSGTGIFYLSNVAELVFLEEYSCPVTQYYIHNSSGIKTIEYRPNTTCSKWLTSGNVYTARGELTIKKDVWKTVTTDGHQVEEKWLRVDSITTEE